MSEKALRDAVRSEAGSGCQWKPPVVSFMLHLSKSPPPWETSGQGRECPLSASLLCSRLCHALYIPVSCGHRNDPKCGCFLCWNPPSLPRGSPEFCEQQGQPDCWNLQTLGGRTEFPSTWEGAWNVTRRTEGLDLVQRHVRSRQCFAHFPQFVLSPVIVSQ